jgi:chromate transport protein ChrA
MKQNEKNWHITVIAGLYLVLCSISLVRYAVMNLRSDAGTVPAMVQLLCLGMVLSAVTCFVKPRLGHKGLILFTVGALVAIGTTDPKATVFHLIMLCLLVLPYIRFRRASPHAQAAGQ